jgi:hypothetical protein
VISTRLLLTSECRSATHLSPRSDLNTAPFDSNDMVTFWIALTNVPTLRHSALEFASRSHRDFALPYWQTISGMKRLDARGYTVAKFHPLSVGDATVVACTFAWARAWAMASRAHNERRIVADNLCVFVCCLAWSNMRLGPPRLARALSAPKREQAG